MRKLIKISIVIICILFYNSAYSIKQLVDSTSISTDTTQIKLKIGIKHTPPFIIIDENNDKTGVCIDLWEDIASELNVDFEYVEYDLKGLLGALENSEIDICINPLTVTSERISKFDFTQPFFISELDIAVSNDLEQDVMSNFLGFFNFTYNFLKAVSALFIVLLFFGLIIWLAERKENEQFHKGIKGIFDGIWWSAVTMTTVGYGDKAPQTGLGRILGTIWMFTSIIIISSFTAGIAATVTLNQFSSTIEDASSLKHIKTGTVKVSNSENFLLTNQISYTGFNTAKEGIKALKEGKIKAFVYDKPILGYYIHENKMNDDVFFVHDISNSEYYSFSLPTNHPFLKRTNKILIKKLESIKWKGILNKYSL